MSDLVGNPEDRFSRVAAQIIFDIITNEGGALEQENDVTDICVYRSD